MLICLIGGSGSGKDTQGTILAQKLGLTHISMGGIIRAEAKRQNPVALAAQEVANQGKWVSGDVIAQLLESYLVVHAQEGVILNGFPRSIDQANYFPDILARQKLELSAVVHLHVPDSVLLARMANQVSEGHERDDVTLEIMAQRLQSYKDTIEPILAQYKSQGVLVEINGAQLVEQVTKDILLGLKPYTV